MQIRLNGEEQDVQDGSTVADLVTGLGLDGKAYAVEVNRAVVPRSTHAEHTLHEHDEVEIVTVVGGG